MIYNVVSIASLGSIVFTFNEEFPSELKSGDLIKIKFKNKNTVHKIRVEGSPFKFHDNSWGIRVGSKILMDIVQNNT